MRYLISLVGVFENRVKTSVPIITVFILVLMGIFTGCGQSDYAEPSIRGVPDKSTWGIYKLDIATQEVDLVFGFHEDAYPSCLRLNNTGDALAYALQKKDGSDDTTEIYIYRLNEQVTVRLTDNNYLDTYPAWSPDDKRIAFLSRRDSDLDLYLMQADGEREVILYDSGDNDADIDWLGSHIVFTSRSAIWTITDTGTQPRLITNYSKRGSWGTANLPAGDYDPRISPDGRTIVFERLENTSIPNGGYDLFTIGYDGNGENRLTGTGYTQGLAGWSHSGKELVYIIAAIDGLGTYDIYTMRADGTNNRNVTPDYFPENFLCHSPVFSLDDRSIYFLGEWWQNR